MRKARAYSKSWKEAPCTDSAPQTCAKLGWRRVSDALDADHALPRTRSEEDMRCSPMRLRSSWCRTGQSLCGRLGRGGPPAIAATNTAGAKFLSCEVRHALTWK